MGDGMADWLAYGLEDAFSDSPEIAIIRKNKIHSGLLRYDTKGDLDWWHVARDILAQEKPNYVIMMLGVSDRQNIRETRPRQGGRQEERGRQKKRRQTERRPEQRRRQDANKDGTADKTSDEADQPSIIAPEPQRQKGQRHHRIPHRPMGGDLFAAASTRPSPRSRARACRCSGSACRRSAAPKSTADAVYLNDLYRARAEKAGAIYIDVWDGFVDEGGKFTTNGPDYEGQMRRLRSGDGVYFTKYGARKLAHYVERELRRYMSNRALPVALPSGPIAPLPADAKSAVRPLAGPVVPLTVTPGKFRRTARRRRQPAGAWRRHRHPRAGQRRAGAGAARPRRRFRLAGGGDGKRPAGGRCAAAPAGDALARTAPAAAADNKPAEPKRGAAGKTSADHGAQSQA